jgi:hypothetical protein
MDAELGTRIEEVLDRSDSALTSIEIAEALDAPLEEVDQAIWAQPDRFAWQPGHRWVLATAKASPSLGAQQGHADSRGRPLVPREPVELRAITLESGAVLKVGRRALDTSALFSVRSQGTEVQLTFNSAHELFAEFPMPFEEPGGPAAGYKALLEILLEAWALHEDSLPPGTAKRALEDARLMWGRRALELIEQSG